MQPGGLDVPLKRPDARRVRHILGDGNCLFRSFSYLIAGCEDQHVAVRAAILTHMRTIGNFLIPFLSVTHLLKPILKLRTWTETVPGVQRLKSLLLLIYYTLPYCYITQNMPSGLGIPLTVLTYV